MSFSVDTHHQGHYIYSSADLDPERKKWIWRTLVSWQENGATKYRTLYGLIQEGAETRDEAIAEGLTISIKWIENGKPDREQSGS